MRSPAPRLPAARLAVAAQEVARGVERLLDRHILRDEGATVPLSVRATLDREDQACMQLVGAMPLHRHGLAHALHAH